MMTDKDVDSLRDSDSQKKGDEDEFTSRKLDVDQHEEWKAVRKLDLYVLPMMTFFYLLAFLDRTNIGNARVAGLQTDLGLTDTQYQICVTVLFVPYILSEIPSNLLFRKIGPRILIPTIVMTWGAICTLQGTVTSFAGLAVVRAFLGLVEGPMFPGIVLYLSGFYTRKELSLRIAMVSSSASLAGAFSGLLAAAIENMDGVGGKPGWAWIFILEGLFTVLVGFAAFFLIPPSPQAVSWLTEDQKGIVVERLVLDRPTIAQLDRFSAIEVWRSITSPHVIFIFVALFMDGTTLYGLALFLPSIVNQLGFSATTTQLISVGPYATAFVVTLSAAYLSDRFRHRGLSAIAVSLIALPGFAIFLATKNPHVAYGSLYLSVSGMYATPPILYAWMANNSEPHYRRATSVALSFVATNAGGILSTWIYPKSEGPRFIRASIINLTFVSLIMMLSLINVSYLIWANNRKNQQREELLALYAGEDGPDGGTKAWSELGDRHPDFIYTL